MVMTPEDFTEQAQEVLGKSQEIVRRHQHSQWDVEHILMALLEQEEGVPADILQEIGASIPAMRSNLHGLLEEGPKVAYESSQIYVSPRAQRVLQRAKTEADRLNDDYVGAEHLLVGAVQDSEGRGLAHEGRNGHKPLMALGGRSGHQPQ